LKPHSLGTHGTALKDQYGPNVPQTIGHMLRAVHRAFDHSAFMADALRQHLPADHPQALAILLASRSQPRHRDMSLSLA